MPLKKVILPEYINIIRRQLRKLENDSDYCFYTDGSVDIDNQKSGYSFVMLNRKGTPLRQTYNQSYWAGACSYDVEAKAIESSLLTALTKIQQQNDKINYSVCIISDSLSVLKKLSKFKYGPNEVINSIINIAGRLQLSYSTKVTFRWIPSHKGIYYNEMADSLAKSATSKTPTSMTYTTQKILKIIERDIEKRRKIILSETCKWRIPNDITFPPQNLTRSKRVKLRRLRCNAHSFDIGAYRGRTKKEPSYCKKCKDKNETLDHVFTECCQYQTQINKFANYSPLTNQLWKDPTIISRFLWEKITDTNEKKAV